MKLFPKHTQILYIFLLKYKLKNRKFKIVELFFKYVFKEKYFFQII